MFAARNSGPVARNGGGSSAKLVYKSVVDDESLEGKIGVGYGAEFYSWYSVLENLSKITTISENEKGEFLMMYNCTTHEPQLLQLPDYKPEMYVDNTSFDVDKYYTMNGISMNMEGFWEAGHYDVNMAALLRIGEWLDYLKEEGVYDNTRIIITSDHGRAVGWFDNFTFGNNISTLWYMPLLMVKDFDAHGFETSTEFMTNADACVLAVRGDVVKEAVNPFTGNPLDGYQKNEDSVKIITSENWYLSEGNTFPASDWYTVSGTPYDNHNWEYLYYK